ncbi:shikimate dehydrogenase [Salinivibrio kushneri]|uniref:shikimate dehydrogenase n=1 Tax=Salinivibrio kushneri TaxID=1908198 RepID=UPI0022B45F86|nr:shikimate dehydrogenase [Salinivibrio kushneri]WBA11613.1 shikimate dehydrogenase [Salinivibrio kushneri]
MTDRYCVVGHPIGHSKSPQIHAAFATQTQQDIDYQAIEAPLEGFVTTMQAFFAQGGHGANVTVPFKQQAYDWADTLTERARRAGAVNTLVKQSDGSLLGDNTDGAGLVTDLHYHHVALRDKRIMVVGAGGAARGVLLPLLEQAPASLMIVNRTEQKAQQLAAAFGEAGSITRHAVDKPMAAPVDVIINATSASLHQSHPPLPQGAIGPATTVYDMVYQAGSTTSNQWAQRQGAGRCLDGLGMLVEQAAESFAIWRGCRPQTERVREQLREALNQ